MNNVAICGTRVIVNSFAEGTRVRHLQPKPRTSENDILAYALWLEKHKGPEAMEKFLEDWCDEHPPKPSN
jgi:hypothetical protein